MSVSLMANLLRTQVSLLRATLLAFLASLLIATPAMAGAPVPRTISNVATIAWDVGGRRFELPSNQVDIETVPSAGAVLETLRLTDGTFSPALLGGTCAATAPRAAAAATGETPVPPLASYNMVVTTELLAGRPLILAVDRPSFNRDSQAIETMRVVVATPWGDREEIALVESSADSGRFVGIILTTTDAPVPGDCRLSVHTDEALPLTLSDTAGGSPFVQGSVRILVDPFGISFDSRTGAPVSDTRITLIDDATGQPAQVFGDDGISAFPSTIATGRSVTDSRGNRYDFPAGEYRFPLVRPGRYRLLVEPVSPYVAPSTATPAELAPLRRPDGLPFDIVAGSYGAAAAVTSAGAVRIDIPLDRPVSAIVLEQDRIQTRGRARRHDPLSPRHSQSRHAGRHRRDHSHRSHTQSDAPQNRIGSS